MNVVTKEPVITWGTVAAVLNAIQLLAIPGLPIWVHTIIVVLTTIATVLAARAQTVPNQPEKIGQAAKDLGIVGKLVEEHVLEHKPT